MLATIIDVDEAMYRAASRAECAQAILFDFACSSLSLDRSRFLHGFFRHLSWPVWYLNFSGSSYWNNHCQISFFFWGGGGQP